MTGLRLNDVSVHFGGIHALDQVNAHLERGVIHGLIGPNGAGKTTLINAICGLVPLTGGGVEWDAASTPKAISAMSRAGIARTFQTPAVFAGMSSLANVMVGGHTRTRTGIWRNMLRTRKARAEERTLHDRATRLLEEVGFSSALGTPVDQLGRADKGRVELARALMSEPNLLLLDEPTAGLSVLEVTRYAKLLQHLRTTVGVTIVLVEHNVPFVFGTCTSILALDNGRAIAAGDATSVRNDAKVIASYLGDDPVGSDATDARPARAIDPDAEARLVMNEVSASYDGAIATREVSLKVRSGELVAVFGRNGAGKSTALNSIVSMVHLESGTIELDGARLNTMSTDRIVRSGVGFVPQDGSVMPEQTVEDNLSLGTFWGRLGRDEVGRRRDEMYERFPRLRERRAQLAGTLSGGERQMLAIAKVLMRRPSVLILDEPSIGLAPAVVTSLADVVGTLRDEGLTILVAEQNVSWIAPIADRAYVIESGKIVREGPAGELAAFEELSQHYLGEAAATVSDKDSVSEDTEGAERAH